MTAIALGLPGTGLFRTTGTTGVDRPASPMLIDRYGRRARDLRVSLTDRCNLRCQYCMPAEGLEWAPAAELLTDDELLRLLTIAVTRLGIEEVRFTGGEPLLRKGLERLIGSTAGLRPRPEISLTTNAVGLARRAAALADAGVDRINVSLDTLDPDTFTRLTRRDRLSDVLAGLRAAAAADLRPVKINSVLLRGINDHEAPDLLQFALDHGYHLRFIEQMPLDAGHTWQRSGMVTADEIHARLAERFTLLPHRAPRAGAPAELFDVSGHLVDGAPATVGVIASVTRPFCGDCDRTRLTADGQLRSCLFARTETDLRGPLRSGADDEELAATWRTAMWGKPAGHGLDDPSFAPPQRPMSAIGG